MKKGLLVFSCIVLAGLFSLNAIGTAGTHSEATILVDNFDTPDQMDWTWAVQTSRFVAEGYPEYGYFDGEPLPLKAFDQGDSENKTKQVFGTRVAYDRKGNNWMEIYPSKGGKNYEIPLKGKVDQISFWVWGANYRYRIDVLVRDADGSVHVLPAGDLAFHGWKNKIVSIPTSLRQQSRERSGAQTMTFVGFRVRSDPNEFVDRFDIFFDKLEYSTNSLPLVYDGYELTNADFESKTSKSSDSTTSVKSEE